MVGCSVDEQILIIPKSRLNRELLLNAGNLLKSVVCNDDGISAYNCDFAEPVNQS